MPDLDTDDPSEADEPLRCAVCLAAMVSDARKGLASGNGHVAVTVHQGTAVCLRHFEALDQTQLLDFWDRSRRKV